MQLSSMNALRARALLTSFMMTWSLYPSLAYAQAPGIDAMFAHFGGSAIKIANLVVYAAVVVGMVIAAKGVLSLKDYSESGGRTQLKTPIILVMVGACMFSMPLFINTATQTLALGRSSGMNVMSEGMGGGAPGVAAALKGVLLFVKMVGVIAVFRGLLIFKGIAEGNQSATMGRGLTHVLGGAASVNIDATIRLLSNSVSFPLG